MTFRSDPVVHARCRGVTLIELVIVIMITSILLALIAQFAWPVRSYVDTARRAELADVADTALRRMARDLRLALPNSVRVTTAGGITYLEFLIIRTGGRYRYESAGGATTTACPFGSGTDPAQDVLLFGTADTCFKSLGNLPNLASVTASDYLVVFNLAPGTTNANAYEYAGTGGNKSQIGSATAGTGEDRFNFASHTFTYESPGRRFHVIEGPVTYACAPSSGGGTLRRYWNYGISAAQPTSFGGSNALLADKVTGCSITYDANAVAQSAGLVTMKLQLTAQVTGGSSETVSLYHAVHVNNVP